MARLLETRPTLAVVEAVAMIAALGELAVWRGGRDGDLPPFEAVGFDGAGRLVVLDERPGDGDPVQRLAQLQALARPPAGGVAEWEGLLHRAAAARPRPLAMTAFLAKLARFEPVDRRRVLAMMVQRMDGFEQKAVRTPANLAPARGHLAVVSTTPDLARVDAPAQGSLMKRSIGGFLAVFGLVLLGAALTLWTTSALRGDRPSYDAAADRTGSTRLGVDDVLAPAPLAAATSPAPVGAEPLPAPVAPLPLEATAAVPPPLTPPVPSASSDPALQRREQAVDEVARAAVRGPEFIPSSVSSGSTTTSAFLWTRPGAGVDAGAAGAGANAVSPVYSSGRHDVEPARLVRLPDDMGTPHTSVHGTVELVIDAQGTVEHVKLVARGEYAEIQRLARAWRQAEFVPASHEGKPVRFRMSLPIE